MRRILSAAALATVAAVAAAAPAAAAPPQRFHEEGSESEPGFVQCDGFAIDLETTGRTDYTVFSDGSGDVVKVLVRSRARDTLTNTETGASVVNRGVFQQLFTRIGDSDEFTHALVGFRYMGTVAGRGLMLQDAGRIEYSPDEAEVVFIAGHHFDIPGGPDVGELFCAELA